jgi:ribosome-associated protein
VAFPGFDGAGVDPARRWFHGNHDPFARRLPGRETADLRALIFSVKGGPLKSATLTSEPTPRAAVGQDRAFLCARVAADHKARDIVVLDMRGVTPLYDFFVLATGGSRRQIHTIAEEIDAALHAEGDTRLGIEGYEASKWVVQDYGDVVVHVFDAEARAYYALEELWADAPHLDWERD